MGKALPQVRVGGDGGERLHQIGWRERGRGTVHLKDALILFKRLGVDVRSLSAREFSLAYLQLARRYHPDSGNPKSHELMANINAARTTILKAYDHSP
jgi:DnaJ-class molecular chaperone